MVCHSSLQRGGWGEGPSVNALRARWVDQGIQHFACTDDMNYKCLFALT